METELRRARGHAKAAITNRSKEIIHLMKNKENEELVHRKLAELNKAFGAFEVAHDAYHCHLTDQGLIDDSVAYYESVKEQVAQVCENVDIWSAALEASSLVQRIQVDVRPEHSVSQMGSKVTSNSVSSRKSSRLSLIQATAEKSILKAESDTLARLQEMEVEELKIRQRKAQLELEIKLARAKAKEKALAEAVKQNYECDTNTAIKHEVKSELPPLQTPLTKQRVIHNRSYSMPSVQPEPVQAGPIERLIKQQQEAINALTLPQPELQTFGGDPTEYYDFIRAFEHLIERKIQGSSARLYYLVQYTTGQVRDLVRSCLAMPETTGYAKARELLAERYGQPYHIATAFVERVTNGPQIPNEDAGALQKFSILLTSCSNTLREIGYLNRLENPEGLRKIMERLPYKLRQKWREVADTIQVKENRDANLADVTEFVTTRSRVASHPIFGKLSDPKPHNTGNLRPTRRGGAKAFASEAQRDSPQQPQTLFPAKTM